MLLWTQDDRDMVSDEHGVAADMLNFLQEFLDGTPRHLPLLLRRLAS